MTMNSSWRGPRVFGAGLLVAGIWAAQTLAQPGGAAKPGPAKPGVPAKGDSRKPVEVKFKAEVHVIKRRAVAHKAFALKHPQTGKAIAAHEMLTLPGGKKVKAGDYYAELNKLEKQLNEIGHTLRDEADKVLLQKTVLDAAKLDGSAKTLRGKHLALNPKTMKAFVKRDGMAAAHQAAAKKDTTRVAGLRKMAAPKAAPKAVQRVLPWNYSLGHKSVVAAYLEGKMEVTGKRDVVDVLGEAGACGWLSGHKLSLLHVRGSVRVPEKGASTVRLNVYVGGQTVYSLNKEVPASSPLWSKSDGMSKPFDYQVKFGIKLGPIPITVTLGARGSAGVRYFV